MSINGDGKEQDVLNGKSISGSTGNGKIQFQLSVDKFTSLILNIKIYFLWLTLLLQIKLKFTLGHSPKTFFKLIVQSN